MTKIDLPGSRNLFRLIAGCSAAVAFVLAIAAVAVPAPAQTDGGIMSPGSAAVTGFSGVPNYPTDARIDATGPSMRVVPLPSGPNGLDDVAKQFTVTARDVGQVFGVTLDDQAQPDIFVAATSAYGLAIFQPGAGRLRHGATRAQYTPNLFGPPDQGGGPGSIWRIDGRTGQVSLFANVSFNGIQNTPASLGGLAFDARTQQIFVADRATGMIHRFGMDGSDRGVFDHGVDGRAAAHLSPVPLDPATLANIASPSFDAQNPQTWGFAPAPRRIFGLAVQFGRLYYAVADGPSIWSVGIRPDGSFANDVHFEVAVPSLRPGSEISQISFDGHPHLYVAERAAPTGAPDFLDAADGGQERVKRFWPKHYGDPAPGWWQTPGEDYATGMTPQFQNADGGVDIKCGSSVWATGERLLDPGNAPLGSYPQIDGLQGTDQALVEPANMPPQQSRYVNYYDNQTDPDARGHMGAIAIWNMCTGAGYVPPPPPPPIGYGCPPGMFSVGDDCFVPPVCPDGLDFHDGYCGWRGCRDHYFRRHGVCLPPPRECQYGEWFDGDRCIPIGCPRGLERNDRGYCRCPEGRDWRDGHCEPPPRCPRDEIDRYGRCIPIGCPRDEQYRDGRCVPIGCPRDEQYRDGRCVPIGCPHDEQYRDGRCVPIGCPRDEQYRDGRCVPVNGCPRDEVYRDGRCVPVNGCPNDEVYRDGRCVPVNGCPRDEVYRDGRCVPVNGCPRDEVYRDGRCVPVNGCPRDEVYRDGRCVEVGGCPRGEEYRDGRCVEVGGCPRGEIMRDGRCVTLHVSRCPRGETMRDGECVTLNTGGSGSCTREQYDEGLCHHITGGSGNPGGSGTCTREQYDEGLCHHITGGSGNPGGSGTCTREQYDEGLCHHITGGSGNPGSSGTCTREQYDEGLCHHITGSSGNPGSEGTCPLGESYRDGACHSSIRRRSTENGGKSNEGGSETNGSGRNTGGYNGGGYNGGGDNGGGENGHVYDRHIGTTGGETGSQGSSSGSGHNRNYTEGDRGRRGCPEGESMHEGRCSR